MPRSILIKAKVCGWGPRVVAFPCQDHSAGVTDLFASSGCGSGPASIWSEFGLAKIEAQAGTWHRRRLSLRGSAVMFSMCIFPLILYYLSILPLPEDHRMVLKRSFSKSLWKGQSPMVRRQFCYQRLRNESLGMPSARWKTNLPGLIFVEGYGVGKKGERRFSWP